MGCFTHGKMQVRLAEVFRAIALGGLAASAASCAGHHVDLSGFDISLCEEGVYHPVRGLRAPLGVDYVGLASVVFDGPKIADAEGTQCAKATSGACATTLAAELAKSDGWILPTAMYTPTVRHFVVTTRGDEVHVYRTLTDLDALLRPVDSAKKAALVLAERNHRIRCDIPVGRKAGTSFELVTESGDGCDDIVRHVMSVGANAATTEVDSEILTEADPDLCNFGRRPEGMVAVRSGTDLGAYFALVAHLEAAAIVAFERLAEELRLHGAPTALVRSAERARRDEIRHARAMRVLAQRFGARVPVLEVTEVAPRDLLAIAVENAAEGCVREAFGAVVAAFAAEYAEDPEVAAVMRTIAIDEARHAELAFAVDAWAHGRLDARGRAEVAAARTSAIDSLVERAAWTDDVRAIAGYPTFDEQSAMVRRFVRVAA